MKAAILDTKKAKKGELTLPRQFEEPLRQDLIRRAVHALQAAARQPYGADPEAGKRASAELSRRRRKYRGSYGHGISRVPRKILSRRGTRMYFVGAFAPGTVGGRRAHPPKAEKEWAQKINKRENRKAIRSALAAVMDKELVAGRGHRLPTEYPFIAEKSFESVAKTAQVEAALVALGFGGDLGRAAVTKVRAGKAKMRGRKTRRAISLLIVTGGDAPLLRAAANIPGVDAVPVEALNAELLAPGTHPGRAALFTEQAIAALAERKLFLDPGKKPQASRPRKGEDAEGAAKEQKTTGPKKKTSLKAAKPAEKSAAKPAKRAEAGGAA